jgi:hypothetical protein
VFQVQLITTMMMEMSASSDGIGIQLHVLCDELLLFLIFLLNRELCLNFNFNVQKYGVQLLPY